MIKYVQRVPEFECIRFEGGFESAKIVSTWLTSHGITSQWFDALPAVHLDGGEVVPSRMERLEILEDGETIIVYAPRRVVVDENDKVHIYTDEEFLRTFDRRPIRERMV